MMKKFYNTLNNICGNRWFILIFIPIAIVFLLFYSFTTSPFCIYEGTDSAVFKTMGLAILQGKIPYVDIFDHKGPVLYFINALGQWLIPGRLGIFLLQIINLTLIITFLYWIGQLFTNNINAFFAILITLIIYYNFVGDGNQCEEWSLLYISISLYITLLSIKTERCPSLFSIINGMCFAIVFFIRPNDAVMTIGGLIIGLLIYMLSKKRYREITYIFIFITCGFLIVTIPIIIYFAYHNAIYEAIYGLIVFNIKYAICSTAKIHVGKRILFFILFVVLGINIWSKKKYNIYILAPVCILSFILVGSYYYSHYFMVFIPLFMLYIVSLFNIKVKNQLALSLLLFYACSFGICHYLTPDILKIKKYYTLEQNFYSSFYQRADTIFNSLSKEDKDSIWNYNLGWEEDYSYYSCFIHSGIIPMNKVPLPEMYLISNKLNNEDDITLIFPPYIAYRTNNSWQKDKDFIYNNYNKYAAIQMPQDTLIIFKRQTK